MENDENWTEKPGTQGLENDVDGTEKTGIMVGDRCIWDGETRNTGWRIMLMLLRNLEQGVENDVDVTENLEQRVENYTDGSKKPGTWVGE